MMLIEETTVPDVALPVAEFKAHLRLGTGFGEESLQEGVLRGFLRAAIAAIEARTGKVLITRDFTWTLTGWRDRAGQVLPVAPVTEITQVTLIDAIDTESELAASDFRLEADSQRPRLRPSGSLLPMIKTGSVVRIGFTAGYAETWGGLPADLGQAVLLLAAHYYEYRNETALSDGCMPFGVTSLIQRYRAIRIGVGAGL
ncbi:head-tail connector protein [Sedimentitalea todarodis]|uniref:Head-tail connector protein n=1 Tax=Sedimentitalea todarodis TaxID=1631240 RepID=A0ABU3VCZ0_9RHOB|nr:head-tail connector protein [Sedimentitalea todarodis]MDU9003895.1 head-tail connector protein [Sedimentitalea todarodis]